MPKHNPIHALGRLACLVALILVIFGGASGASAQSETPPAEPAGEKADMGARLYAENCLVCHGERGGGRVGATLAKNWPSIRPDLTVRAIIARGVSGSPMPAWSQQYGGPLSDGEIEALVSYILSWQTGGAPSYTPAPTATLFPGVTPPPDLEGDPNRGAALFGENCDMCHGPDGAGRSGATLAQSWGGIRPDLSVRTIIANGVSGSAMPAWSAANGGPLSETDIEDLTAFVLALGQSGRVVQVSPVVPDPNQRTEITPAQEWAGVILFVALFAAIIAIALLIQRRSA